MRPCHGRALHSANEAREDPKPEGLAMPRHRWQGFFRYMRPTTRFRDYRIAHCDLEIEVTDDDAFVYSETGSGLSTTAQQPWGCFLAYCRCGFRQREQLDVM